MTNYKGLVTILHVKGVTEPYSQYLSHHRTMASIDRPQHNIRRLLVHPKDKVKAKAHTGG